MCEVCPDTRGETLADLFLYTLEQYGVIVEQMRTQGYDGAANMSGTRKGVQARIRERIPDAQYVHCKAHVLNLAIVHSCADQSVRTMMATVQEIAFSFHYSAKKLTKVHDELAENANARNEWENKAQDAMRNQMVQSCRLPSHLHVCLPRSRRCIGAPERQWGHPGQQVAAILRFDFVIALVVSNHILQGIVPLTCLLQATSFDLLGAVKECRAVIRLLEDERNDFTVFDALYDKAVALASTVGVEPSRPREARNQKNRANPEVVDTKQYWRVSLYCKFLDHLITELNDRLVSRKSAAMRSFSFLPE